MQGDVEQLPTLLQLQRHFQLAHCEVMAEVVGDGGDWAERVGGDGPVELSHAGRVQLPAHQLQVAQVPETIRGVTKGQTRLATGRRGGAPMVVGCCSLQGEKKWDIVTVLQGTLRDPLF